jgi:hypothetical protein
MKKQMILAGLLLTAALAAAQVKISGDLTALFTLGNAEENQMVPTGTGNGVYEDQKNGIYTAANVYIAFTPASFFEGYVKITATKRPGSLYVPLQLENYGASDFSVSFDTVYGKVNMLDALFIENFPVDFFFKAGKFKTEAASFQNISKYKTESVLYMLKTANTFNYEVEAVQSYIWPTWRKHRLSLLLTSSMLFDEAIHRLYDQDGSVAQHGAQVLGEYAPQFLASARLQDFKFIPGRLSLEGTYGYNAAGLYSGHSAGLSGRFDLSIKPDTLTVPFGLAAVYYQKNIDALSGTAGTETANNTTGLRDTVQAGVSSGIRYTSFFMSALEANLAASYSQINHIYRDPLTLISASVDVQYIHRNRYFVGAGFVAGTLTDAEWKTKTDVTPANDGGGYDHTFTFKENFGYEVYGGIKFANTCRLLIGFNENKGLAMNRTLESRADGQIKYKQPDTAASDQVYETSGLFVKFTMNW